MDLNNIIFHKTEPGQLQPLKTTWLKSLTAPQDDMWESFIDAATQWEINRHHHRIGYANVNQNQELIQFFILPEWLNQGVEIMEKFIRDQGISTGIVGTNNPVYLSLALHLHCSLDIHSYLFESCAEIELQEKEGNFRAAENHEIERLVSFCYDIHPASKGWLKNYIQPRISKGEYFVLEKNGELLGTCEVRKSISNPSVANLGMMVSSRHRYKGLGTFLLGKAKEISLEWKREPICSCKADNIGSVKAIRRNGFSSIHRILSVTFDLD